MRESSVTVLPRARLPSFCASMEADARTVSGLVFVVTLPVISPAAETPRLKKQLAVRAAAVMKIPFLRSISIISFFFLCFCILLSFDFIISSLRKAL